MLAIVTTAEAVRAQGDQPRAQPWGQLVGNSLDIVRRRDDGTLGLGVLERVDDVGLLRILGGMQTVPALHGESFAAQFVVTGYAPHVGLDPVLLPQHN